MVELAKNIYFKYLFSYFAGLKHFWEEFCRFFIYFGEIFQ